MLDLLMICKEEWPNIKPKKYDGFTKKYNVDKLVYYETCLTDIEAKDRERRIKRWRREWKEEIIEKMNPGWRDLSVDFEKILTDVEKMELLFGKLEDGKLN
jgi:hypothetical protein